MVIELESINNEHLFHNREKNEKKEKYKKKRDEKKEKKEKKSISEQNQEQIGPRLHRQPCIFNYNPPIS